VYRQAATGGTMTKAVTGLSATVTKYAETSSKYCANVAVKNTGTADVRSWTVTYDVGSATVTRHWYGIFTHLGSLWTAKSEDKPYAVIPAGGVRYFGFCAQKGLSTTSLPSPVLRSVSAP